MLGIVASIGRHMPVIGLCGNQPASRSHVVSVVRSLVGQQKPATQDCCQHLPSLEGFKHVSHM